MDEAAQVTKVGPRFTLHWEGDARPGIPVSLESLLQHNKDDAEIREWAPRATVGGSLVTGGGAQPACSIRRIS